VLIAEFGFHAIRMMDASAWTGIPLVVQFHGSDAFAHQRTTAELRERYRRLFKVAASVIVKSQPMREQLLRFGASPEQLVVSPCGADSSLFYGATPGDAPPLFVAVGRFVPKKAPHLTIRAFADACARVSPALSREMRLVMVGDGPLMSESRRLVSDLNLANQISFPGLCNPQQVAELMRSARAFIQHSIVAPDGDSEGSPVSVVEAQLSGLPVVSTRHAGIPEVVLEGESGFLVDEGDVSGMADFIAHLAEDPDLAARLGRFASSRALSSFTVNHHVDDLANVIKSASS
jgi:glycosyltransferase involved in cell wall biosynthesis